MREDYKSRSTHAEDYMSRPRETASFGSSQQKPGKCSQADDTAWLNEALASIRSSEIESEFAYVSVRQSSDEQEPRMSRRSSRKKRQEPCMRPKTPRSRRTADQLGTLRYCWEYQVDIIKGNREFVDFADFESRLLRPLNQIPTGNILSRQALMIKPPAIEEREHGEFWAHWLHKGKGKNKD